MLGPNNYSGRRQRLNGKISLFRVLCYQSFRAWLWWPCVDRAVRIQIAERIQWVNHCVMRSGLNDKASCVDNRMKKRKTSPRVLKLKSERTNKSGIFGWNVNTLGCDSERMNDQHCQHGVATLGLPDLANPAVQVKAPCSQ